MKNKFLFSLVASLLMATSVWALGPQSLKVTFDGTDNAGWKVSSNGSIISTEDGVMNVQMKLQDNNKYRADLQYQISGTYTFDKSLDIVWAVKLTAPLPGSANSRKFEINYKKEGAGTWINGINNPSGQIDCTDGGCIYYFNLGADGLNKLSDVPDGAQTINNIHFIFADAVCETEEEARYGVDWVATFASVADLTAAADWMDDQADDASLFALVNTTQKIGYNVLANAISGAEDGDVIEIRKNITTPSGRTDIGKAITFKAVNGAVIYNGTSDNNMLFLSTTATGVTFEDVIIDGNGKNRADVATMEAGTNYKLILKNVTIRNLTSGRDVTNNGYIDLYGNNILPNGIRLNMNRYVTDHETTHTTTTPIHFSLANDYKENADAVHGTTDYTRYSVSKNGVEWETYADVEHNQVRVRPITVKTYDLTVSTAGYASLFLPYAAEIPAGAEVFTGSYNDGESTLTLNPVLGTVLPKNTAVVVKATEKTYTFNEAADDVAAIVDNDLQGVLVETEASTLGGTNLKALTLGLNNGQVGFYLPYGGTIGANKIYLLVEAPDGQNPAPVRIVEGSTVATSIENNAEAVKATKVMIDGAIYTIRDNRMYDMLGRLVK